MAVKRLGIYFGKKNVSIVEVSGTHIAEAFCLPLAGVNLTDKSRDELNEGFPAVSDEIQIVAKIKASIRDRRIQAKKACLGLANKDQFIRGFQMLLLSKSEMDLGVLFEVKKHIPFQTEDLLFDYQRRIDKKSSKMDILFVAATKNSLDASAAILSQAGFGLAAVEPAGFALIRLLGLTKQFNPKLSFALVAIDGPCAEFSIVDKNFPCFSRDINLLPPSGALESVEAKEARTVVERLTSEIRISLDFFRRQFSGSSIAKLFFLSKNTPMQEELILGLSGDLGLPVERVELEKNKEAGALADLDAFKAYALALRDTVKINLSVDLAKRKAFRPAVVEEAPRAAKPFVFNLGMLKGPLSIVLVLLALGYGWPLGELNKANNKLVQLRRDVETTLLLELRGSSLEALESKKQNYIKRADIIEKLVSPRVRLTSSWNAVPQALEKGMWLEGLAISISEGRQSLSVKGAVYLGDEGAEFEAAHAFHQKLLHNSDFMRGLKKLELTSINKDQVLVGNENYAVTYFDISGN